MISPDDDSEAAAEAGCCVGVLILGLPGSLPSLLRRHLFLPARRVPRVLSVASPSIGEGEGKAAKAVFGHEEGRKGRVGFLKHKVRIILL